VTNSKGKCRGIKSLKVNGKVVSGNLLPLAELNDGAVVEAILEGSNE